MALLAVEVRVLTSFCYDEGFGLLFGTWVGSLFVSGWSSLSVVLYLPFLLTARVGVPVEEFVQSFDEVG